MYRGECVKEPSFIIYNTLYCFPGDLFPYIICLFWILPSSSTFSLPIEDFFIRDIFIV
jgi:hypothetical protein